MECIVGEYNVLEYTAGIQHNGINCGGIHRNRMDTGGIKHNGMFFEGILA